MSILYCTIPHFSAAIARRDDPELEAYPIALVGPERRIFDVSAEAAGCGVGAGMTIKAAEVRCPDVRLLDANVARCREELEILLQLLEQTGPKVESHGWGAAYVDLDNLVRGRTDAAVLCRDIGRAVRQELGKALQPALGWNSSKFTAQAAARHTRPGHVRTVAAAQEQRFLSPLSVRLLPLAEDTLQRLRFLGLYTLGQYASLPHAAVWQQFGNAGKLAHRCARGKDDRPVIPREQALRLVTGSEFETPLVERERIVFALKNLVSPLLAELHGNLKACGRVRLKVGFDDGSSQEKERTFLLPTVGEDRVIEAFEGLLDGIHGQGAPSESIRTGTTALSVALEQIQDTVAQQLTFFPLEDEREGKLQEVQRYLTTRFGVNCLRRAVLTQPGAPLPEWRVGWQT
ncbi:hypothetical protein ACFLUM_02510 [Chloroflexota bacterium]